MDEIMKMIEYLWVGFEQSLQVDGFDGRVQQHETRQSWALGQNGFDGRNSDVGVSRQLQSFDVLFDGG